MAMVFFMELLTARTTSAKYGMSKETIRMSVLRAKIRNLLIPEYKHTARLHEGTLVLLSHLEKLF